MLSHKCGFPSAIGILIFQSLFCWWRGDLEELTCCYCLPMQGFAWILMGFPKLAQMIINIMSWCCAPWEVSLWKGLDKLGKSQYAASIPVQVQQVANYSHDIPKLSKEKHMKMLASMKGLILFWLKQLHGWTKRSWVILQTSKLCPIIISNC